MGQGSHAQVTRGFEVALSAADQLSGIVGLDVLGLDEQLIGQLQPSGDALAEHGVLTGPLEFMPQLLRAKHQRRWVMVAPNSNYVPPAHIKMLNAIATDVLVPSEWARTMLAPLTDKAIQVVRHGIHAGFERNAIQVERLRTDYESGQFRVVHFSTTERQRKGSYELLCAWTRLIEQNRVPERAQLFLVLDHLAQVRLAERIADAELRLLNVMSLPRYDAAPRTMADLMRQAHVVCQPSRGEAFGLTPLEALACGTPIVATACTGHAEYLAAIDVPGFVLVPDGDLGPIDDGPNAVAPMVDENSIFAALSVAYANWTELSVAAFDAAPAVAVNWSWSQQLAPWIAQL